MWHLQEVKPELFVVAGHRPQGRGNGCFGARVVLTERKLLCPTQTSSLCRARLSDESAEPSFCAKLLGKWHAPICTFRTEWGCESVRVRARLGKCRPAFLNAEILRQAALCSKKCEEHRLWTSPRGGTSSESKLQASWFWYILFGWRVLSFVTEKRVMIRIELVHFMLATCSLLWMQCSLSTLSAQEQKSKLSLSRLPFAHDADSTRNPEKYKIEHTYSALISHATSDANLLSFLQSLKGRRLRNLTIDSTTLTEDQIGGLDQIKVETLTVLNCEMSEAVAKGLGSIQCEALVLRKLSVSDQALSGLLSRNQSQTIEATEVRGCTAEGWRGLSNHASLVLKLTNCDFDDRALLHIANTKCFKLQLINAQLTGATLESLKTQKDCLSDLSLLGCPINDEALLTLPEFSNLQELDLTNTLISNEGLGNFVATTKLNMIKLANTKVTKAWGVDLSRKCQDEERALIVSFYKDQRWAPLGGYCKRGEFHLYKY